MQQETSRWQIYNTVASSVPAFITAIVYPSYTDTFGRRYLFILSLTGIFLQFFVDALTTVFNIIRASRGIFHRWSRFHVSCNHSRINVFHKSTCRFIFLTETLHRSMRQKRLPVLRSVKRVTDFYLSSAFNGKRSLYI